MRVVKIFIHVLLLITMPTFLVFPHDIRPNAAFSSDTDDQELNKNKSEFSYDQILELLEKIESGDLEKECSLEEFEKTKQFIVLLAKQGVLPDDSEDSLSLEDDVEELLSGDGYLYQKAFSFINPRDCRYMISPAVMNSCGEVILCKSWIKKQCKHIKKFVKKHKKALIIGAAVVAAVTVVVAVAVVSSAAATAAAASAGGAAGAAATGSDKSSKSDRKDSTGSSIPPNASSVIEGVQETPKLKEVINDQVSSFKDNAVVGQFFDLSNQDQRLSWEESGRAFGSLLAHSSLDDISKQGSYNPQLTQEIQQLCSNPFLVSVVNNKMTTDMGHFEIDKKFSTDYAYLCSNPGKETNFNALSYQVLGEKALEYGYYDQAIQNFGKAIETNPGSPIPYLDRSMAHFGLGQYDLSLEDYNQFTLQSQQSQNATSLSITEFSLGFAKGIPKGIYDSGSGLFLFISDLVKHPVSTGKQMWEVLTLINDLARSEEWGTLSASLVPEIHQLIKQWDSLSSDKRGELAGYAFGKYGSDIVIPGALAKAVSKGIKGAQELSSVYKNLQTAEQALVLESVADLGSVAKITEVIQSKTVVIAKELGFNSCEISQLVNIEESITNMMKNVANANQDISFSKHALLRAVERRISRESIFTTLKEPLKIEEIKIDSFGRPSQRFIGKKAEVVINPDTQQIVSVNPTSTKKLEKLEKDLLHVND